MKKRKTGSMRAATTTQAAESWKSQSMWRNLKGRQAGALTATRFAPDGD